MRKLIYGINISLDGCCDHTKFSGGDDIQDYFGKLLEQADTVLYGRKTFDLMVPFWPEVAERQSLGKSSNAFAKRFAVLKRVVASRNMQEPQDGTTKLIRHHLREEVIKLKQQPGKAISTGGVELPAQLIEWGLIDEFHMVVHPVFVGQGRRLFTEMHLSENLGLTLTATEVLPSGAIALRYEKGF